MKRNLVQLLLFALSVVFVVSLFGERSRANKLLYFSIRTLEELPKKRLPTQTDTFLRAEFEYSPGFFEDLKNARYFVITGDIHKSKDSDDELLFCDYDTFEVFDGREWKTPESKFTSLCGKAIGKKNWIPNNLVLIDIILGVKKEIFLDNNYVLARVGFKCDAIRKDSLSEEWIYSFPFVLWQEDGKVTFQVLEEYISARHTQDEEEYEKRYAAITLEIYQFLFSAEESDGNKIKRE